MTQNIFPCYLIEGPVGYIHDVDVFNPWYLEKRLRRITVTEGTNAKELQDWYESVKEFGGRPWVECESQSSPLYRLISEPSMNMREIDKSFEFSPRSRLGDIIDFPDVEITDSWSDWMEKRLLGDPESEVGNGDTSYLMDERYRAMWKGYVAEYRRWVDGPALADVDPEEVDEDGRKVVDVVRECLLLCEDIKLKYGDFDTFRLADGSELFVLKNVPLVTLVKKRVGSVVTFSPAGGFATMPTLDGLTGRFSVVDDPNLVVSHNDYLQWIGQKVDLAANDPLYREQAQLAHHGKDVRPINEMKVSGTVKIGADTIGVIAQSFKTDDQTIFIHVSVESPVDLKKGDRVILTHEALDDMEVTLEADGHKLVGHKELKMLWRDFLGQEWKSFIANGDDAKLPLGVDIAADY